MWTKASKSCDGFTSIADRSIYRYFKVRGGDGDLYIVRHNELRADWELTMFEHAIPRQAAIPDARGRQNIAD
jgi:hypothetical protein